jgi:TPR repeat protein
MKHDKTGTLMAAAALVAAALSLGCALPFAPQKPPAEQVLSKEEAARKYNEGRALERWGDEVGAFHAYLAAGTNGHGLAQKKLGEIYDRGGQAVQRDYAQALRWYEKARAQGIDIPGPPSFSKGH